MSFLTLVAYLSVLTMLSVCLLLSRHLLPFLIAPATLASIRFVGEVMQEEDLGPLWVQHHLGDVGIIANNMTWGITLAVAITVIKDGDHLAKVGSLPGATFRSVLKAFGSVAGPRVPIGMLAVSLLIYALGLLIELQTAFAQHTLNGEEAEASYSGEFDWPDAIAYTIGMAAMALNYVFIGRRVSRKISQDNRSE